MKLDKARVTTVKHEGKQIKMTPADLTGHSFEELRLKGLPIGRLETEIAGDETGLPPGKYNLFAVEVNGQWRAYAEAGGRVVKAAKAVDLELREATEEAASRPKLPKPHFEPKGWCFYLCFDICIVALPFIGCVWSIRFCERICF
jgi:hypothetical protein